MTAEPLNMSAALWDNLIGALKERGKSIRESGAFLLGPAGGRVVTEFICYDDLDPHSLETGIIEFDHIGFSRLWPYCAENKLRVLADVHTHPGSSTRQSGLDKANPMVSQAGHLAFIVPNFARNTRQRLQGVGLYRFVGNQQWETLSPPEQFIQFNPETTHEKHGIISRICKQAGAWLRRKIRLQP